MSNQAKQMDANKIIDILKFTSSELESERIESFNLLESMLLEHEQPEIPVTHRFHGDMYMREITLKKDTLLTGRIHKFDHFDIMLSGKIMVSTNDGEVKELSGLNIMKGKAGKKRAGYVLEDTYWITIHSAQEQDPENMIEFLTVGSFEELNEFNEQLALAIKQFEDDRQILTDHAEMICYEEET